MMMDVTRLTVSVGTVNEALASFLTAQNDGKVLRFAQNDGKVLRFAQNDGKVLRFTQNDGKVLRFAQNDGKVLRSIPDDYLSEVSDETAYA